MRNRPEKPMRVVQLGCGVTGLVCAELLANHPQVEQLILADLHLVSAEAMQARLRHPKLKLQKMDATDSQALYLLLQQADLVINSLPWSLHLGVSVLTMAAKMGIWYLDFAIVANSFEEFDQLSQLCQQAGVTAVTAAGEDPGMSNIFACYASEKLDSVSAIRVIDGDNGTVPGNTLLPTWSPVDFLWETSTPAAVFCSGKIHHLPPLCKRQIYQFPEPLGALPVYHTIHEETFLLSQFFNEVRYVDFRLSLNDELVAALRVLQQLGLHRTEPIQVGTAEIRPLDVVCALLPRPVNQMVNTSGHACLVVEVTGKHSGHWAKVVVWTLACHQSAYHSYRSNATGYLVGLGGAVTAELLLEGHISGPGLSTPEHIPARLFVDRLQAKGLGVYEKIFCPHIQ